MKSLLSIFILYMGLPVMIYNFVNKVQNPDTLTINGLEEFGVGEALRFFFEEFFTETDRKLAQFKSSLHTINWQPVERKISSDKVSFIDNANKRIPTPTYYQGGEAEMAYHVENVINAVMVVDGFKTEVQRFYDWMKKVVKLGRIDQSYKWTITDYDEIVGKVSGFIKELQEGPKSAKLGEVYVNFPEAFGLMNRYNQACKSVGSRDAEVMARDLKNVYAVGNLLVNKIKNGDITVDAYVIKGVQEKVSLFNELTAIVGACLGLMNELTAVFDSQLKEFSTFK